jgi:hypothetical protein
MCRNESAVRLRPFFQATKVVMKVTKAIKAPSTAALRSPAKKYAASARRATHPDKAKAIRVAIRWRRAVRSNFARRDRRLASMSAFMISGASIGWVGIGSPCACACGYSTPDWRRVPRLEGAQSDGASTCSRWRSAIGRVIVPTSRVIGSMPLGVSSIRIVHFLTAPWGSPTLLLYSRPHLRSTPNLNGTECR